MNIVVRGADTRDPADVVVTDFLHRAMQPHRLRRELEKDWSYPRNRDQRLLDVFVERVYPRDNGQRFALHIRALIEGVAGPRWVELWGEITPGDAQMRTLELRERLAKRRRQQLAKAQSDDAVACLPGLNMVVRLKGLDERIDGLKLLTNENAAAAALRDCVPDGPLRVATAWRNELLGHRLGRRCVARFSPATIDRTTAGHSTRGSVIAKFYKNRSERGQMVFTTMQRMWRHGWDRSQDVRIAEPLSYVRDWNCLLSEDCRAKSLHELSDVNYVSRLPSVAKALHRLHDFPPDLHHAVYTPRDESELIQRSVSLASGLFPHLTTSLRRIVESLSDQLHKLPSNRTKLALVHRDFYDKQVLVHDDALVLLDFDTLCVSDPAIDVGNFVGHLYLAAIQGHFDYATAERAFADAYEPMCDDDFGTRVRLYTATTLLRIACVHMLWPPRQHLSQRLLERASELS